VRTVVDLAPDRLVVHSIYIYAAGGGYVAGKHSRVNIGQKAATSRIEVLFSPWRLL